MGSLGVRAAGYAGRVATNRRFMPVPAQAVWDVLADPGSYAYWVVGSKVIRDADDGWPAPGTRFHHTVGLGPLKVADHTESVEADEPRRLRLRAKGRPFGTATVTLELTPEHGGTTVTITESPDGVFRPLALAPALHVFTRMRNAESLMRLEDLARRRTRRSRRGRRTRARAAT
jgi:uncharacterized protein YndB with AHSA1/START domain